MVAASYPCDRTPHPTLKMKTPHKMLYGKGIDLSHLRIIDAREFVDVEDVTTLDHASWEGMVCGFRQSENNSFRS